MKKLLSTITAALFAATGAFAANVSSVVPENAVQGESGGAYVASPVYSAAAHNLSEAGWYAGLTLTWKSNQQRASNTQTTISDNIGATSVSFTGSSAPDGSGIVNTTSTRLFVQYLATTTWYFRVTPEIMYECLKTDKDYEITLTIGDNTYTITVPNNIVLSDGSHQWYPAIAVVDGKVYGDMGLAVAAGATAAAAGKEMEFFVEPTGCPDGVSVVQDGDVWKLVVSGPTSIESVGITLSETEFIFDGEEHTVDVTAVMLGEVTLNKDVDYTVSGELSATNRGEYTVTVTGMGNFEGTATATWRISNTTGTGSSVSASVADSMTNVGNDFTLSDSSKLEYDAENAVWYAGITITWPMDKNDSWSASGGGYARYVSKDSVRVTYSDGLVSNAELSSKFRRSLTSGEKDFTYLSTTTWKVGITPEIIVAALDEGNTELVYTMTAGAFIWGDSTEGDPDGVKFQDYTITIPLDENLKLYDNYGNQAYPALPYVAQIDGKKYLSLAEALVDCANSKTIELIAQDDHVGEYEIPEGVTVALGSFGSASATYVLSVGAVLTSDAECTVLTRETGYGVESSGEGPYTYTVVMQHVHDWSVVAEGNILTATCVADTCPLYPTTYSMRLFTGVRSGATEDVDGKTYDGESMSRRAEFSDGFTDVFPNVETQISVAKGGESVDTINNAGEYVVTMIVTGLGDGQSYELSKTVTVSPVDITGATLTFTPATCTYNGEEQSTALSVAVNGLDATLDNGSFSATDIGSYPVTVSGTGNFTGSVSGEWEILNTTGEFKSVIPTADGLGEYDSENNALTITDSTALEYSNGSWFAGIALEWPVETKGYSGIGQYGYAHYIPDGSAQFVASDGEFTSEQGHGSYQYNLLSSREFDYLSNTTWRVEITPAIVEAALSDGKTALTYTMRAGAYPLETYENGVAFADYTITLPLDNPVEFVLGEGETYDLGDTVLTTTRIKLEPGATVTSGGEQTAEGAIFTDATGYEIDWTESEGVYTYTTKFTHEHDWTIEVTENRNELVATCANPECDVGGAVSMSLSVETGAKEYDGNVVAYDVVFGNGFTTAFPEAVTSLTVNGNEGVEIRDAGEYAILLAVTGLGDSKTYELTAAVSITTKDISNAMLVIDPATPTYNGEAQSVSLSVTVDGLDATFGVDTDKSTITATDMGTYSVTVNGNGNFSGELTGTWEIVNTTGAPTSVTASAADSMTNEGGDFTLSDSSKLEYDAENQVWYAGITITWPMEKHDSWTTGGYAHYVAEAAARVTSADGSVSHVKQSDKFRANLISGEKDFDYLATTTWKVPLTPAIIEAALSEGKTSLDYTMNAGAFDWGDSTEGGNGGVAFADYTITIPLDANLKLYDDDGKQVYPAPTAQTIIEEIKADIADEVSGETAESAKAKIDILAGVAGEGNEQEVADWVAAQKGDNAAEFYMALAQSEYVKASFELGTALISAESDVEISEFVDAEGGFTLAVKIDGEDVEALRVKATSIIKTATALDGEFSPLDVERIVISGVEGEVVEMTVTKAPNATTEFFKVLIPKDE